MLDINLFRADKGGDPDLVRESQRRRDPANKYGSVALVDQVIDLDRKWRDARYYLDGANKDFNDLNKAVAKKKKAGEDVTEEMAKSAALDEKRKQLEKEHEEAEAAVLNTLKQIGNLVHDSVPVHDDEDFNEVYRTWGTPRDEPKLPNHVDLVNMLGIANLEKGSEVAGGRGYYLTGYGAMLNHALINYALSFLAKRGHMPVQTPFFMNKMCMGECAQLADYDEQLYKVTGEGEDKYLIATSEQTLCSLIRRTWQEPKKLPLKMAGYSTCFRKEAGSHGRDTLGIFRVHQFEKVEQFCVVSPEKNESWEMMEQMLKNAEDFYQSLELPYRVVNIVSGELNDAAAKKYDLEAWFPSSKTWRELVSCSNCTDYQARNLEVRYGQPKKGPESTKLYCHLLNSTLTATERTLCCILENYQTPEGFRVPDALKPFMHGIEFIPFQKVYDKKGRLVDVSPAPPTFFVPKFEGDAPLPSATLFVPAGGAGGGAAAAVRHMAKLTPAGTFALKEEGDAVKYVEGDVVLTQPHAILRHFARIAKRLYPGAAAPMAKVESVLEWLTGTGSPALAAGGAAAAGAVEALEGFIAQGGGAYTTGDAPTIADVSAAAHLVASGLKLEGATAELVAKVGELIK